MHSTRTRISARVATIAALATVVTACAGGASDDGDDEVLQVTMGNHVYTDQVRAVIPVFEEETGLTVEVTVYGEDQLSDQYNVRLNAGSDEIDVMMFRTLQEGELFSQNGWLSDLSAYAEEAEEWDLSDFQEGPLEALTVDGSLVGIPAVTEREVLYYRTDLLAAAGLGVPETLEELEAAAAAIQDGNTDVAGFVGRGATAQAVPTFASYLYGFGGDWTDDDGAAAIDSPEAVDAYEYYGGLLRDYGPEGATSFGWTEAMAVFSQGGAGFYTEADSLYLNATDPAKSAVADDVGFAVFPAGPAGAKPFNIPSYALGISEYSTNKDAAWRFIEYMTGADQVLEFQQAGVPGARDSVWDDPEGLSGFPEDLSAVIAESVRIGVGYDRPRVARVGEARDIVGQPLVVAIQGGDVADAADAASEAFQVLLDDDRG